MKETEIREAAYSASQRSGTERINFVKESYPVAYWAEILQTARMLNDDICKYYGIGRDII